MLFPKKIKYKKQFKGKLKGISSKGHTLKFGDYGLKSLNYTRLNSKQIESARKIISRKIKKFGNIWIRVFPDIPVSKKPTEVRMGKGKGSFSHWVSKIKPGQILFEINGISYEIAKKVLTNSGKKLQIQCEFVYRQK